MSMEILRKIRAQHEIFRTTYDLSPRLEFDLSDSSAAAILEAHDAEVRADERQKSADALITELSK